MTDLEEIYVQINQLKVVAMYLEARIEEIKTDDLAMATHLAAEMHRVVRQFVELEAKAKELSDGNK